MRIPLINQPLVISKTETIEFKAFLKKEQQKSAETSRSVTPLLAFIPFNPVAFIDPIFLSIVAGVVIVALLEKGLANHGHVVIAEAIYTFLKIALPIVGFAAMYFLITQLSFLGW